MKPFPRKPTAIIILAAGGSRRLGQPKQLLPYKNESLLRHAVICASQVKGAITLVVTGAQKERIKSELATCDVCIVENDQWEDGLATSVTAGLSAALAADAELSSCIFAVCDQPHLDAALLQQLMAAHLKNEKGIVAASYGNTRGTPVFFDSRYFSELLQLQGDEGAKKILSRYPEDVATVPFQNGAIDIDTPDDYKRLRNAEG